MPDTAHPAPEGCVYGPWWDEKSEQWFCYRSVDGFSLVLYAFGRHHQQWLLAGYEHEQDRELLRLAKENAELKSEVKRLEDVIEKGHAEWRMNAE